MLVSFRKYAKHIKRTSCLDSNWFIYLHNIMFWQFSRCQSVTNAQRKFDCAHLTFGIFSTAAHTLKAILFSTCSHTHTPTHHVIISGLFALSSAKPARTWYSEMIVIGDDLPPLVCALSKPCTYIARLSAFASSYRLFVRRRPPLKVCTGLCACCARFNNSRKGYSPSGVGVCVRECISLADVHVCIAVFGITMHVTWNVIYAILFDG